MARDRTLVLSYADGHKWEHFWGSCFRRRSAATTATETAEEIEVRKRFLAHQKDFARAEREGARLNESTSGDDVFNLALLLREV